jgi:hypothetical protein
LLVVIVIAACAKITTPPTPTDSPGPATPKPSLATPLPSNVTSPRGLIAVFVTLPNETHTSPLVISGEASVFEGTLQWLITDASVRVIAQGFTTASRGAPGRGSFSVVAPYTVPSEAAAFVAVFTKGPRDEDADEGVRTPVTLR